MVVTIQEFFKWGMDRDIPDLLEPPRGLAQLNLGPGNVKDIRGTIGVGRYAEKKTEIEWEFPARLPFDDSTIGAVHMHHFLEHFTGADCLKILGDVERVLAPGGVVFVTTPYPDTPNYWRALDHKSAWCEETWAWLFENTWYEVPSQKWKLRLHTTFIMGIVERNRALLSQLVKPRMA